jgi:hypothetical protein
MLDGLWRLRLGLAGPNGGWLGGCGGGMRPYQVAHRPMRSRSGVARSQVPAGFIDLDHTGACGLGVSIPNGGTRRHTPPQDCALPALSARGRGRDARVGIRTAAWG